MASGMDTHNTTQAQEIKVKAPWHRRLKWKIKIFLKRTIGHTRLYESVRQAYHRRTEMQRRITGDLVLEKHRAEKQRKEQEAQGPWVQPHHPQFLPLYLTHEPTPASPEVMVHAVPLPVCGGAPIQVHHNGEFVQRLNQETKQRELMAVDTRKVGVRPIKLQPMPTGKLTPRTPEHLPERVGTTTTDALFLLDQPPVDTDVTLPRMRKVG